MDLQVSTMMEQGNGDHGEVGLQTDRRASSCLSKSVLEVSHLTEALLRVADEEENPPTPPTLDPDVEKLLPDVLYSVHYLMAETGQWKVASSSSSSSSSSNVKYGDGRPSMDISSYTIVSREEILQFLQESFRTDQDIIQELRQKAEQREPPEICLNLTVIEADIQCQRDAKESTNSHIRIKTGPKNSEQFDTRLIMNTLRPKWKSTKKLKLSNVYNDYISIELWHEKEEDKRKRRHFIPGNLQDSTRDFLLAELQLPLKNALDRGLAGWYRLENRFGTNMAEPTRVQLSGQFSCESELECDAQEAYDTLLRFFIAQRRDQRSSEKSAQGDPCGDADQESVSACARAVLSQFALILNLSPASQLLSWWSNVTVSSSPLDWQLLSAQFNHIKASLVMGLFSADEKQNLSQSVSRVIDHCISCLKNLEICFPVDFPDRSKMQLASLLQTMKSIQDHPDIRSLLKERNNFHIREVIRAALQGFSRQWWNKMSDMLTHRSERKGDLLRAIFTITSEAYNLLQHFYDFYHNVFMNESDICCLKVAYRTIVMELIEAIEPHIIACCEAIPVSDHCIGENGIECDFLKGSHLMKIYKNLIRLCGLRCPHMSAASVHETGVEKFPAFFKAGVENQLALTTSREYHLLKDITLKDNLQPVGPQTPFSASLLEATAIPHRMKIWWFELVWPKDEDRMVYLKEVVKSLIFLSISYCENLINRIDYITQDDDVTSQQLVNEKICVAITNMDSLVKEVKKYPDVLGYKSLASRTNGEHSEEIQSMVDSVIFNIQDKLQSFVLCVIDQKEQYLEKSIVTSCLVGRHSTFLTDVLHPTFDLLRKLLNVNMAQLFLECLWINVLKIMRNIIHREPVRDLDYYGEMLKTLQNIYTDLTPDSEEALDLNCAESQEYKSLVEELKLMEKSSASLICSYYQEQHNEQQEKEVVLPTATLVIRTWFREDSDKKLLVVHILMAKDIVVPPEEAHKKPLEYFVKVQLLSNELHQGKENSTPILKEDPAIFNQEFEFDLEDASEENILNGIILLTLKDHNKTRSNTFLGGSYVPLAGVPQGDSSAQNMYLKMTSPIFSEGCQKILRVLAKRESDKQAKAFLKKLRKRQSSTVVDLLKRLH